MINEQIHTPGKNKLLISEPFMPDPNFQRTLVYLVEYGEEGAVGFVLNQPTGIELHHLVQDVEREQIPVLQGGPVGTDMVYYLHREHRLNQNPEEKPPYWGGNFDLLSVFLKEENFKNNDYLFFLGYSGWAPGQLESELQQETWIVTEPGFDLFDLHRVSANKVWKRAMLKLGGRYALLANSPENPFLN